MPGAKRNCGSRSVLSQASTVSPWASSGARAVRQSSGKSTAAGRFSLGFLLIEQGAFRPQKKGDRKDAGAILSLRIRAPCKKAGERRSEEHTSELQSLMSISYAVYCL